MTDEERAYIVLRVMLLVVGLCFYFLGYISTPGGSLWELSLWALLLFAVSTIVVVLAALSGRRGVARTMLWVLPVDLVVVAIFSGLTARQDAFYPVCVLLVISYATMVSRRDGILASMVIALAYLAGSLFLPLVGVVAPALLALKTASITLVGVVVSNLTVKQRQRERDVERAVLEKEIVNQQLARRISELQAVSEITELIHSTLDFDEVGASVVEILAKVISLDSLCVFVIDKAESETLFSASVGIPDADTAGSSGRLAVDEVESYFTCLRVFDHGGMMVLFCALADEIEVLSDDDRLAINAVASELVVAVENSRLYKLTRRLAVTDELTGMHNYRYLQQRLDEEVTRAKRYGKYVSLIMMDADDFKDFNDSYGHIAGDVALSEFAAVLASVVREVDVVARYGGEEFAIVLPETDAAGAFVAAEKVREALGSYTFADADGARCCTLTVSMGVATYPTYAFDKESLLREADDALYRAKNGGRNRVCTPIKAIEPDAITGERP